MQIFKWFGTVAFAFLPMLMMIILRKNLQNNLGEYISQLLFVCIMLSAPSILDIFDSNNKILKKQKIAVYMLIFFSIVVMVMAAFMIGNSSQIDMIAFYLSLGFAIVSIIIGTILQILLFYNSKKIEKNGDDKHE